MSTTTNIDETLYALVYTDDARFATPGEVYATGTLDFLLGGAIYIPRSPDGEVVDIREAQPGEHEAYVASMERELAQQRACSWAM